MSETERLARLICGAMHGEGPETYVARWRTLPTIGVEWICIPDSSTQPLWTLYTPAAEIILQDRERQKEAGMAPPCTR